MKHSSNIAKQHLEPAAARARLWLVAFAVVLGSWVPVACDEKGPPSRRNQVHQVDGFAEQAAAFAWPDEPSHVVALEFADHGTIRIGLYDQVAPTTVAHFVDCATRGVYDDTLFHRVIKGFMIQGGDPSTRKRGPDSTQGDWGDLSVEDEYQPIHHDRGVVSLANRGRSGSAGSQFFIVHQDSPHLDGKYTAFGRVISGIEVVDAITEIETDTVGRWGSKDTPLENVVLTRALLERGAMAKGNRAFEEPARDESGINSSLPSTEEETSN